MSFWDSVGWEHGFAHPQRNYPFDAAPERLALIAQLWDSLENEQLPLTSAQQAELEQRCP
jgi:hypothetical protein